MKHTIKKIEFEELKEQMVEKEGIVCLGCGGDLNDWIQGVTDSLNDANVTKEKDPNKIFSEYFKLATTGGRIDLVFEFGESNVFDMGRMAIWRLEFGDCSWISDYLINYASQH